MVPHKQTHKNGMLMHLKQQLKAVHGQQNNSNSTQQLSLYLADEVKPEDFEIGYQKAK